jgi:hypothetical protein
MATCYALLSGQSNWKPILEDWPWEPLATCIDTGWGLSYWEVPVVAGPFSVFC